jgi:hypothetical protein
LSSQNSVTFDESFSGLEEVAGAGQRVRVSALISASDAFLAFVRSHNLLGQNESPVANTRTEANRTVLFDSSPAAHPTTPNC